MSLQAKMDDTNDSAAPVMRAKLRMLEQMAEALEDEASGLYRRAAVCEDEEAVLEREIEERQTEINRLSLKLNALRADRDALLGKITALTGEASALREQVYSNEEAGVLAALERAAALTLPPGRRDAEATVDGDARRSLYFRRAAPVNVAQE
jgi:septal ring factor EnvC (AmiA/AmiB activator)